MISYKLVNNSSFKNFHCKKYFSSFSNKEVQNYQFIKVSEKNKHCVVVTIDRTEVHNAFNEILIDELTQVFKRMNQIYPNCRSAILTGAGPSFSAGADLNWMKKMVTYTKEQNERDSQQLFEMVYSIRSCPIPVIGRITGSAFGGGSGLVAACDMAFATNNAKFGFTEVKLGLVPAVISPFVMEKIGKSNCSRFFLTGERFSAEEAKRIGLIQDYFLSEKELEEAIDKICNEIASSGPNAVKICKQLIQKVSAMDMHETSTKSFVTDIIAKVRISEEGQSGLNSFLNKTQPPWK